MGLRTRFLDADVVRRLGRAQVTTRGLVEGFLAGLHRSPYRGLSVEFAGHRHYVPGDEPRRIDWKVYGKRDRYYVKQYHEETNFIAYLLVDASASMAFTSGPPSKLIYASTLAEALSYLVLRQNDAVALGAFDRDTVTYVPPGHRLSFLARLSELLAHIEPAGGTDSARALRRLGEQFSHRGIVVVISDFLDDAASVLDGLKHLKFLGHEVVALHVLDPQELTFTFQGPVRFEGLESDLRALVEPQRVRQAYLESLRRHLHTLRQGLSSSAIDYRLTDTSKPIDELLLSYLATRRKQRRTAR